MDEVMREKYDLAMEIYKYVEECIIANEQVFDIVKNVENILHNAAQHSVHLTALRRGLAVSIFINVILLAVLIYTNGGR